MDHVRPFMINTALLGDSVLGVGSTVGQFSCIGVDGEGDPVLVGIDAVIRSHAVIYRGVRLGDRFGAGHHVLIRTGTEVGHDVSIGTSSVIEHHVVIRDGARLHSRCFVPELSVIEEGAWLGPGVVLTNAKYPNRPETKQELQGVRIEEGAVLGAGVTVLPGIRIGRGAQVGAGAVVVEDVLPGTVVMGNPARTRR